MCFTSSLCFHKAHASEQPYTAGYALATGVKLNYSNKVHTLQFMLMDEQYIDFH